MLQILIIAWLMSAVVPSSGNYPTQARYDMAQQQIFQKTDWPGIVEMQFSCFSADHNYVIAESGPNLNIIHLINIVNLENPIILANASLGNKEGGIISVNNAETLLVVEVTDEIQFFKLSFEEGVLEHVLTIHGHSRDSSIMRFKFNKDDTILYHAYSGLNLKRFDMTDEPTYLEPVIFENNDEMRDYIFLDDNVLVQSIAMKGLFISDISSPSSPELLSQVKVGFINRYLVTTSDSSLLFVTDSTEGLFIFDVTDHREPKLLSKFVIQKIFPESSFRKPVLSQDESLLYLNTYEGQFFIMNILNPSAPFISGIFKTGSGFHIVKDGQRAMWFKYSMYIVYDISKQTLPSSEIAPNFLSNHRPVHLQQIKFSRVQGLHFASYFQDKDLYLVQTYDGSGRLLVQAYNSSLSLLSPKFIGQLQMKEEPSLASLKLAISHDNSKIVAASYVFDSEKQYELHVIDCSNLKNMRVLGSTPFNTSTPRWIEKYEGVSTNLQLSKDGSMAYVGIVIDSLLVFNISNPEKPTIANIILQMDNEHLYEKLMLLENEKQSHLYVLAKKGLTIFDVSNPLSFKNLTRHAISEAQAGLQLSPEGDSVLIAASSQGILRLNIENLTNSQLEVAYKPIDDIQFGDFAIKGDFVLCIDWEQYQILNYTDRSSPRLMGKSRSFFADIQTPIIGHPSAIGRLQMERYLSFGTYASSIESSNILLVFNREDSTLELGDSYRTLEMTPMLLLEETAFGNDVRYRDIYDDFKFIQFEKFISFEGGFSTEPFPKWATTDPENNQILLELNSAGALGIHYVYARMSYRVPDEAFVGLPGISNLLESTQLKKALIGQGYIDRESFNSDFDLSQRLEIDMEVSRDEGIISREVVAGFINDHLYLNLIEIGMLKYINETHSMIDPDYSELALYTSVYFLQFTYQDHLKVHNYFQEVISNMLEPRIKAVLKSYSLELVGEFEVRPSLSLRRAQGHFRVETKSTSLLRASLSIDKQDPVCAQFMNDGFGEISEGKHKLVLEGNLLDLNDMLSKIRINQEDRAACSGRIVVDDRLNPILEEDFRNITELSSLNIAPSFSIPLKDQFQKVRTNSRVEYGSYFEFKPSFKTEPLETLSFDIRVAEVSKSDNPEDWQKIESVEWLSFDSETGAITGNPTQAIVFKSFQIRYTISDEFKQETDEFTVHIGPTTLYIFELASQFGSFIAVIFGCWKYKVDIYTILFRAKYRLDRTEPAQIDGMFQIEIPIIQTELEEQNPILRFMKMKANQRMKRLGCFVSMMRSEQWILTYFDEGFVTSEFISDLKLYGSNEEQGAFWENSEMANSETASEAMRQFALLICEHIFKLKPIEIEDSIISLLAGGPEKEPLWESLKMIMGEIIQGINQKKIQIPIRIDSSNLKQVYGFKEKTAPQGTVATLFYNLSKHMNLHLNQLPLPTCMPVWLNCSMDSNFILLEGSPSLEQKGEVVYIRIFDVNEYILREFQIYVEESDEASSMPRDLDDRTQFSTKRGLSLMYTSVQLKRWLSQRESASQSNTTKQLTVTGNSNLELQPQPSLKKSKTDVRFKSSVARAVRQSFQPTPCKTGSNFEVQNTFDQLLSNGEIDESEMRERDRTDPGYDNEGEYGFGDESPQEPWDRATKQA